MVSDLVANCYLNQCWLHLSWIPGNKLQWNLNQNSNFFTRENTLFSVKYQPFWSGLNVLKNGSPSKDIYIHYLVELISLSFFFSIGSFFTFFLENKPVGLPKLGFHCSCQCSVIERREKYQNALYFIGFVQDCCNSSVLAMELLQSYTKPSISCYFVYTKNQYVQLKYQI